MTKYCNTCRTLKAHADFHRSSTTSDGLAYECRSCCSLRKKAYKEANRERVARQRRGAKLRERYGIDLEDYDRMLAEQGGGCAICGTEREIRPGHSLHIDHCHATGRIRGILCGPCNRAIGFFREDVAVMRRAIDYLAANADTEGLVAVEDV